MILSSWASLVVLLAVMWALQMYLAYRQSRVFMAGVRRLRGLGRTAIGVSSQSRLRRRTYVALAADDAGVVTGAIRMSGLTVWARPRPADHLCGRLLDDLVDDAPGDRRGARYDEARAAAMAARTLRNAAASDAAGQADVPEESVVEEVSRPG